MGVAAVGAGEERGILDASAFPLKWCLSGLETGPIAGGGGGGRGARSIDNLRLFSALEKWQRFSHQPWPQTQAAADEEGQGGQVGESPSCGTNGTKKHNTWVLAHKE